MRPENSRLKAAMVETDMETKARPHLAQRILLPNHGLVYLPIELKPIERDGIPEWMLEWREFDPDADKDLKQRKTDATPSLPTSDRKCLSVPLQGVLWEFVCLVDREDVLNFVSKWGPLEVALETQTAIDSDEMLFREPVRIYSHWVNKFRAMLYLVAEMRYGKVTAERLQEYRNRWPFDHPMLSDSDDFMLLPFWQPRLIDILWSQVQQDVNRLLDLVKAFPSLQIEDGSAYLALDARRGAGFHKFDLKAMIMKRGHNLSDFGASALFTMLVFELIGAITSGVYICSKCGVLFDKRKGSNKRKGSKPRQRDYSPRLKVAYCSDECSDAAHRDQQREARRKKPVQRKSKPPASE